MTTDRPLPSALGPDTQLGDLVTAWAGASRALQRFDLDYCCNGGDTIAAACARRHVVVDEVLDELRRELTPLPAEDRWDERPAAQLLAHILDRYHAGHRAELPRLVEMAEKVEKVHADRPECPRGLAHHLHHVAHELEQHMQKEEQCLFPSLLAGQFEHTAMPISVMESEHEEHGRNLARMRELAHDFAPPEGACNTWRALYLGLEEFEREVMQHVHLENHVLFPRARAAS